MTLDPQSPFPGASRVPETLGYFATSAGERRAVVAMPVADHATTLAGRLAAHRHRRRTGQPRRRGRRARPAVGRPRTDPRRHGHRRPRHPRRALRPAHQPGHGPSPDRPAGHRATGSTRPSDSPSQHQRVVAFPRPQTDDALAELVDRLDAISRPRYRSRRTNAPRMAGQALDWLGQLLARDHSFYDLHRQAPVDRSRALHARHDRARDRRARAASARPTSQRSLVDFASHLSVPIDARRTGGRARSPRASSGTASCSPKPKSSANTTATTPAQSLDAATQQVLASLLDTLESLPRPGRRPPHPSRHLPAMSQPIRNIVERQAARSSRCRASSAPARRCRRSTASRGRSPAAARRCCCWAKRAPARS